MRRHFKDAIPEWHRQDVFWLLHLQKKIAYVSYLEISRHLSIGLSMAGVKSATKRKKRRKNAIGNGHICHFFIAGGNEFFSLHV